MYLKYHEMNEKEKEIIARWKYPDEYSIYDLIPYSEMKEKHFAFANPENQFYTFYDADKIIGFTNLSEEENRVFFGIGVNPNICGKGYGTEMTKTSCELSKEKYPNKPIFLEVRNWNIRAVRCYIRAGFVVEGEEFTKQTYIGEGIFIRMYYR